jgi:hypothetical protein
VLNCQNKIECGLHQLNARMFFERHYAVSPSSVVAAGFFAALAAADLRLLIGGSATPYSMLTADSCRVDTDTQCALARCSTAKFKEMHSARGDVRTHARRAGRPPQRARQPGPRRVSLNACATLSVWDWRSAKTEQIRDRHAIYHICNKCCALIKSPRPLPRKGLCGAAL